VEHTAGDEARAKQHGLGIPTPIVRIEDPLRDPPERIARESHCHGDEQRPTERQRHDARHRPASVGGLAATAPARHGGEHANHGIENPFRDKPDAREALEPTRPVAARVLRDTDPSHDGG
jgi:hypothetical protein